MLNSYRPTTWLPEWQEHHRYNILSASSAGEMPGTKHATLCCLHIFQQFDTVSRQGLWHVLRMFSCPEKFINLVASLHDGRQDQVSYGNTQSKNFLVSTGVKQGCVLAPTLFSFYLAATLEVAFRNTTEGVYIQTRHNADLFYVSHFN